MTPEQQLQYLQTQQHVLQRIQKQQALNAQIKAQVEAQKKQAALNGQGQLAAIAASQQKVKILFIYCHLRKLFCFLKNIFYFLHLIVFLFQLLRK
jgi:hypothetical protein